MLNAQWIGKAKSEINSWPPTGATRENAMDGIAEKFNLQKRSILFRKEYVINKFIKSAVLKICGLGFYEVYINGSMPDENRVFAPIFTDYFKKTLYDVYDVSSLLRVGKNSFCVHLGGGWFCPLEKWFSWRQVWHGNPRLLFELSIVYTDGSHENILSDESWKLTDGPVMSSCIYDGEIYDANELPNGVFLSDFNDSSWKNAVTVEAPTENMVESFAPPIRVVCKKEPINVMKLNDAQIVFDFGTNDTSLPYVLVTGKKGDTITFNHSENINSDGTLDMRTNNRALAEDKFILSGNSAESYRPHFTWHGFRYLMLTFSSPDIQLLKVEKHIIHSDVEITGKFTCDRDDLNKLHEMFVRTQLACLMGVPIDCPQRDERLPWLGDAHATSGLCVYNFDMRSLYRNFLQDMRIGREHCTGAVQFIAPRPMEEETTIDWNMAYPIILDEYYSFYGDKTILEENYDDLKAHTEYYISISENGLVPPSRYGDWCSLDIDKELEQGPYPSDNRNPSYGGSMYFYNTLRILSKISGLLEKNEEKERYEKLALKTKSAILDTEFDKATGKFGRGGQFSYTYPLYIDIIPSEYKAVFFDNLMKEFERHNGHSIMGVFGNRAIFEMLLRENKPEFAYKLLTKEGFPGMLNMLTDNRTTLTEKLDGGGSGCHCMFGSPDTMFYRLLAGVTIDRCKEVPVTISPFVPDDLNYVSCELNVSEGKIVSSWIKNGDTVNYHIEIPRGLKAQFKLDAKNINIILDGGSYDF